MNKDRKIIEPGAENRTESTEEKVGEAVGGVGGALAGAGIGSLAGPIGTIIGGIAGAVGGWWAGEKAGRAIDGMTDKDETYYRDHYKSNDGTVHEWDDARVGYAVGHAAGQNPGYSDREFDAVENDLRRGFDADDYDWDYEYDEMRPYIREGYKRGRTL